MAVKLLFVVGLAFVLALATVRADDSTDTSDAFVANPNPNTDSIDPNLTESITNVDSSSTDTSSGDDLDTSTMNGPSTNMCPPYGARTPSTSSWVSCNTPTDQPSQNCLGECCRSTGQCRYSNCFQNFALGQTETCQSRDCINHLMCNPIGNCGGPGTFCVGRTACTNNGCGGRTAGEICLFTVPGRGASCTSFDICRACRPSSSSTGPESFVVGDPQFVGLRGQSFQIHGVADEVYNIVSDADLQYNSRFVFLDQGDCPVVNGKKQKGCFAHPGSYLGELGLKTRFGDKIHYVSGSASNGFGAVEINGKQIEIGETVLLAGQAGFVSLNNTHLSTIKVGNWQFDFENSDMFINQRVAVTNPSKLRSHGLLGQTWKTTTYPNAIKYIQGEVDDYVIRSKEVFGDEFVYNSFN